MSAPLAEPTERLAKQIAWVLRIAILLQAIGIGSKYFFTEYETETPLFEVLLYEAAWSQPTVQRIDDAIVLGSLAAALTIVLLPLWKRSVIGDATQRMLLLMICAVQLLLTWAHGHRGIGEAFNWLVPWERAAICLLPICLIALMPRLRGETQVLNATRRFNFGIWLLRVTAAVLFVAHGLKSILAAPVFLDYLLAASARVDWDVCEASMKILLGVIGWLDLVLAGLVLTTRWRWVALYMALWALIAACSRMVHSGWANHFDVTFRSANYCIPFAVFLYFRYLSRKSSESLSTLNDD